MVYWVVDVEFFVDEFCVGFDVVCFVYYLGGCV